MSSTDRNTNPAQTGMDDETPAPTSEELSEDSLESVSGGLGWPPYIPLPPIGKPPGDPAPTTLFD